MATIDIAAHTKNILEYYNDCEWQYRMAWDLENSMCISTGYWDENVKTLKQAFKYQNKVFAEWVNIQPVDRVLDAGCGAGGTSIYLAKNIGCRVDGISIVPRQIELCKANAIKHNVAATVNFHEMDYLATSFEDNSFDVVWALESFCYAQPKSKFIQEAYRILKPGGRLIIVDLFQDKAELTKEEDQLLYAKTMNPMAVASMDTMGQIAGYIKDTGYSKWSIKDISQNVLFAKNRVKYISLLAFPYAKVGKFFGRFSQREHDSMLVGYYAAKAFKQKLTLYGCVMAIK